MQSTSRFTARVENCNWYVSSVQQPQESFDEIVAYGNDEGVFITMDMTNFRTKLVRMFPNNAQAVVFTNSVPSFHFTPCLGPIWITFLSGCYFRTANPDSPVSPPVSLNVAGGSILPAFNSYVQKSFWKLDPKTGLPVEFISRDDSGAIMGILNDQLVKVGELPPPFHKGFTNIVFQLKQYEMFAGYRMPKYAVLDVYWVYFKSYELIHRFSITAERFEQILPKSIPLPETKGIAIITDGRLSTRNGPIVLTYFGTNRFLNLNELKSLPQFNEAVNRSLSMKSPLINVTSHYKLVFIILSMIIVTVVPFLMALRNRKQRN